MSTQKNSMITYLTSVFKYVKRDDKIIIGTPETSDLCNCYDVWSQRGWIKSQNPADNKFFNIEKAQFEQFEQIAKFVTFLDHSYSNALGFAAGVALATDKKVYVNLLDKSLQCGPVLEAIQFIGSNNLKNIICTINYRTEIEHHLDIHPVLTLARLMNWNLIVVDGHDAKKLDQVFQQSVQNSSEPMMVVCITK